MEDGKLQPTTKFKPREKVIQGFGYKKEKAAEHVRRFLQRNWRFSEGELEQSGMGCRCEEGSGCNLDSWIDFYHHAQKYYLTVTGMAFQDVWNLDLERLKKCCVHVVTRDKRIIPFCAYYLTSLKGERLYGEHGSYQHRKLDT